MESLITTLSVLCCLAGVGYALQSSIKFHKRQWYTRRFIVSFLFSASTFLLGIAINFHYPYIKFGFLHIALMTWSISLGFLLCYNKHKLMVSLVFAAVSLVFLICKFLFIPIYNLTFYQVLPLHICNICTLLIILHPLYSRKFNQNITKMLDNFLLCFGLLGAVTNMVIGVSYSYGTQRNFFSLNTFEASGIHLTYFTFCIYNAISKNIIPSAKAAFKNFVWLLPLFAIFIFTNQIYSHNFFFTNNIDNPVQFLYDIFPIFYATINGFVFEFNLWYLVVLLSVVFVCFALIVSGYTLLYKKVLSNNVLAEVLEPQDQPFAEQKTAIPFIPSQGNIIDDIIKGIDDAVESIVQDIDQTLDFVDTIFNEPTTQTIPDETKEPT